MPKKSDAKKKRARVVRHRDDGAATRARIVKESLKLFRKRGVDGTTMRAVADAAGISLGLAYHYFPSKEAIVLDFYNEMQLAFTQEISQIVESSESLTGRIEAMLRFRIEELKEHREIFVALSRVALDPTNPLAVFSEQTRSIRESSIAEMRKIVEHPDVPEDLRDAVATGLWAFMMAIVAIDLFDTSDNQNRATTLAALFSNALPVLLGNLRGTTGKMARTMIVAAMNATGLLPQPRS